MSDTAHPLTQYRREEFLSTQTLTCVDEAVNEFFETMLGLSAGAVDTGVRTSLDGTDSDLWASVRFNGPMDGGCEVRMSPAAGAFLSALLLGMEVEVDDPSIPDTVGEVCNIVSGGWKNRTFDFAARCTLTPPTVSSGASHILGSPSAHLSRVYAFDAHTLCVTLTLDTEAALIVPEAA